MVEAADTFHNELRRRRYGMLSSCTFANIPNVAQPRFFEITAGLYPDRLHPHLVGVPLAVQAAWRRKGASINHQRASGSLEPGILSSPASFF